MDKNEAIRLLIVAAELANKRGAFNLDESKAIAEAKDTLQPKQPQAPIEVTAEKVGNTEEGFTESKPEQA